ncbi:hypothetical protein D187_006498 [Cystobacter fuscus DSM 2262]|uniref:DUF4401 domain-containing protein n=1 Tax=Cystobacter fuscus (strain ATCC 25194 / DSM 2262 / NBRC 100088 / M29) TaxID=1242864 RepID=S9R2F4_CYSF2|nr:DUF4401 domain-containing protein [Cystobacter fuscus]EPX63088.1 hypothetical protein D187_006498 [Cystobacter fuscus DSM 2262]
MTFKPSLRMVLPPEAQERARDALLSRPETQHNTPWFVSVLAGLGAWVASLFLVIFLSMFLLDDSKAGAIVMGLVITAGAVLLRHTNSHVFITQLALSAGLAGQGFFLVGVESLGRSEAATALAALVLQLVLLVVYPDTLQRFLSALFAALSLLYLLREQAPPVVADVALVGLTALAHVLLLQQGRLQGRARVAPLVTPTAFGLVTTLFFVLLMRTWFQGFYRDILGREGLELPASVLTLGLAAVTLYSAWRVMEETQAGPGGAAGVTAFAALALTALLTLNTPGVIAALGVLMLGFHRRNTVLLGLAVLFILVFGVSYYYDLRMSLLAKSLALLGSGLLMLGLRLFIARRFPVAGEAS